MPIGFFILVNNINYMEDSKLEAMRHSCEHVLTMAMLRIWGGKIKAAMGPATDEGFYFDFDSDMKISEDDFGKIKKEMFKIIKEDLPIIKDEMTVKEAREFFNTNIYKDNEYKYEWLDQIELRGEKVSVYWMGEKGKNIPETFVDICSGPHLDSTGKIGAFKLLKIAGAYWHGDEKNKMLTRIYGTAFETKEELDEYLYMIEEAKKRDHRKLGKELDLFTFSELVGSGLPLFTPKGTLLRELLREYSEQLRTDVGYQKVWVPHITKKELYETSGHWAKFGSELFLVKSQETSDEMVMKPMNCPHHQQIYASQPRSYRDLPIKYMETTTIYRDEKAGELLGLSRVRSITQDDSHTFCRPDQIEEVYNTLIKIVQEFYSTIGMPLKARLSYRDPKTPEKYLGESELWDKAESIILDIAKKNNLNYYEVPGEAAFYGPKIDFMAVDALGREWQVATPQLDFVQPKRFGLTYTDSDGQEKTPVMIHFALMGSIERFLSVYIEHTAGNFPVWLSPVQVHFVPVSEKHIDGALVISAEFKKLGIRVGIDTADETVGKKIRTAVKSKVPYIIVVGDKELAGGDLMIRMRGLENQEEISKEKFIDKILEQVKNKR